MEIQLVYTTWPTTESAKAAATQLLEKRLIACANILPPSLSLYRWEGTLKEEHEVIMVLKLPRATLDAAMETLLAIHPYDCPCVVVLPVEGGNAAFLRWVTEQTTQVP
jgi:periplasmic divalent cation tolerance protein